MFGKKTGLHAPVCFIEFVRTKRRTRSRAFYFRNHPRYGGDFLLIVWEKGWISVLLTQNRGMLFEKTGVLRYNRKVVCRDFCEEMPVSSGEMKGIRSGMNRKIAAQPVTSGDQSASIGRRSSCPSKEKIIKHARQRVHEFKQEERQWPIRRSASSSRAMSTAS